MPKNNDYYYFWNTKVLNYHITNAVEMDDVRGKSMFFFYDFSMDTIDVVQYYDWDMKE